uniref:Imidazole glycerol phosphate synthase subunit HisF n=1 Tax=Eiseniibacteriota bacterium TaxID=2212470 RepID=A0A832I4S2_UNCEI
MLARRVIACLDVRGGRVVKGTRFVDLRDVGEPAALAARYEAEGADEICFLDISATHEERATLWDVVRRTAQRLFVPLTVGGGIRSADDVAAALRAGADKVGINSAAVERPGILEAAAARFGRQCVVASVDARRRPPSAGGAAEAPRWEVVTRGGRTPTGLDAVAWAAECARRGAGEILLTSVDRDGARSGYDLDLVRAVTAAVDVPAIASGGAGNAGHVLEALVAGGADAALLAGILHDGHTTVADLKARLAAAGVPVRRTA